MYLFFDTETNGLPKKWDAHVHDLDNWPRMIQLAWSHYDENGNKLAEHSYIIKPNGFAIPEETAKINKITQDRAEKEGVPIHYVLELFDLTLSQSDFLVAHNISFDKSIVGSEMIRLGWEDAYKNFSEKERICTMQKTTQFCKIPGKYGYKWPTLAELYAKTHPGGLLDEEAMHDALQDVRVMVDCFFKLKDKKII